MLISSDFNLRYLILISAVLISYSSDVRNLWNFEWFSPANIATEIFLSSVQYFTSVIAVFSLPFTADLYHWVSTCFYLIFSTACTLTVFQVRADDVKPSGCFFISFFRTQFDVYGDKMKTNIDLIWVISPPHTHTLFPPSRNPASGTRFSECMKVLQKPVDYKKKSARTLTYCHKKW